MWVRLPLDSFTFTTLYRENPMIPETSDNGLPLLTHDNEPNIGGNPMVLAGFLDVVGVTYTETLRSIARNNGFLTPELAQELVVCQSMLLQIRNGIGRGEPWGSTNMGHITTDVARAKNARAFADGKLAEVEAMIARFRKNAAGVGFDPAEVDEFIREITPQESASEAAERILRELNT